MEKNIIKKFKELAYNFKQYLFRNIQLKNILFFINLIIKYYFTL